MFRDETSPLEAFMDDYGMLPGDDGFAGEDEGEQEVEELLTEEIEDGEESGEEDHEEESEESEDSSEDATDEDDEDDDSEEIPDDYLFDIEIEGEVYEVNLPELRTGYLRQEELTKLRTQLESEYSDKITALEVKEAELIREVGALAVQGISDLKSYDNINWAQLKAEDLPTYQAKRLEYIDAREAVQAQISRRSQLLGMQQKATELKHAAYLESQRKLVTELIPDFEKPEFQTGLVEFATSLGISEEDVRSISDAKQLLVLDMARKFAESQVKRKTALSKKVSPDLPEVVRPGTRKAPVDVAAKRSKAALARLADEQTLEAASAAFLQYV